MLERPRFQQLSHRDAPAHPDLRRAKTLSNGAVAEFYHVIFSRNVVAKDKALSEQPQQAKQHQPSCFLCREMAAEIGRASRIKHPSVANFLPARAKKNEIPRVEGQCFSIRILSTAARH